MKALLRFNFRWDYTGEAPKHHPNVPIPKAKQRGSSTEDSDSSDDHEEIEFDQPADPDVQQARGRSFITYLHSHKS